MHLDVFSARFWLLQQPSELFSVSSANMWFYQTLPSMSIIISLIKSWNIFMLDLLLLHYLWSLFLIIVFNGQLNTNLCESNPTWGYLSAFFGSLFYFFFFKKKKILLLCAKLWIGPQMGGMGHVLLFYVSFISLL